MPTTCTCGEEVDDSYEHRIACPACGSTDRHLGNGFLPDVEEPDAVTGLRRRGRLESAIRTAIHGLQTADVLDSGILIVDVDHFKSVNDNFGHRGGDAVLRELAGRLRAVVQGRGELGRWGGEEFVLLMAESPVNQISLLAREIHEEVRGVPFTLPNGSTWPVRVSIGTATYRTVEAANGVAPSWEDLIEAADDALYFAKLKRDQCISWSLGVAEQLRQYHSRRPGTKPG